MAKSAATAIPDTPSRRERRVREMHDRILESAMNLFEQRGVESVKIDDICASADIAQKTFFNHFPTKQHLVREIAEEFLNAFRELLATARTAGGTTAQQIERFFALVATEIESRGPMHRGLVMEVIRVAHDVGADAEQNRQLHDAFGALLRDGVRAGDVTTAHPVTVLSEAVAGSFITLMLNWLGTERYPFRARAAAMARFLGDALRVRKGVVASTRRSTTRPRR
jgi:AcrR family transcriptional regulator